MGTMKVYTCTDFEGYWPVGTAAVIVAESEAMAMARLLTMLASIKLPQDTALTLTEMDVDKAQVVILRDGNY